MTEMDGVVSLHDETVGASDDLLLMEGGKTYRLYIVPKKFPIEILEKKEVKKEVDKGRAKIFKKGDPGWFGPEESYVLLTGLSPAMGWYRQSQGFLKAPKNKELIDKISAAFEEPPTPRYGCIVIVYGTNLAGDEVMMFPNKDPKFDHLLRKWRFSATQASQLQKQTANCSAVTRDLVFGTKKQGRGVKWESVSATDETLFLKDDLITAEGRERLYKKASTMFAQLPRVLAKPLADAEWEALIGAKSAEEAARAIEPPQGEEDISSLIDG